MPIKNWSVVPGNNTSAPPFGAPESTTKIKDFNDLIRQVMADTRYLAASGTVASAATTDLGAVDETWLTVSGTATITSFGTVSAGIYKFVTFSGALTLTHNATSLILLTGANRATAAGDCALYQSLGGGNWKEYFFHQNGFVPVRQGAGVGQLNNNLVKIGWSGTRLKTTVDATDLGNVVFDDTFKGANQLLGVPGFQRLPGGLIIQGGITSIANGVGTTVALPLAFPAAFMSITCSHYGTDTSVNAVAFASGLTGITLTHGHPTAVNISWVAVGY